MAYVYVIGMEGSSLVKIGHTRNAPEDRVKALQSGLPFRLKLLRVYPCEKPLAIERRMHRLLRAHRETGEWFAVEVSAVDAVFTRAITLTEAEALAALADGEALRTFGKRLQQRREARGMSPSDLARQIRVSEKQVKYYETGRCWPSLMVAWRMADAFGVSIATLAEREESPDVHVPVED